MTNETNTPAAPKKSRRTRRTKRETITSVAIAKRLGVDPKTMRARVRRHDANIPKKCRADKHEFYVDAIDAVFDALKLDDAARKKFAKTS